MKLPDEFQLKTPFYNGFESKDDPKALEFIEQRDFLISKLITGTLYVKFIAGDRKGSIARISADPDYNNNPTIHNNSPTKIGYRFSSWNGNKYDFENASFYVIATWDGRRNKIKLSLPHRDTVFLPNYDGPTVWELFDRKAAKEKFLETQIEYDIDGKALAIGDEVLYVNARYGHGVSLNHGKIKEFKASVDSRRKEIWTIVVNSDGVESKISDSSQMVYKK